ncbi:MAG: nucleotide exchange factor GrpE [Pyrinomonadaceae bacterium]|nr:nucleotide exchange factor GrpE [Pyrinomonadaceae bacterium]MCX7640621.1 nucleotide exchange factor GrpE [Pyrinomonadaceae bacterium]MDW8305151.1 nucleotide exchange factor GrpE [Acidobacteriota bacterium]
MMEKSNSIEKEEIKVKDKRRFTEEGELKEEILNSENTSSNPQPEKSPEIVKLENELKQERERREAAEAKLISVQAKFQELIAKMEKETAETRERIRKNLEERAQQSQFQFLKTLLPVLDNLKLAIEHAEKESSFEKLIDGVKSTARSFEQTLANLGVEPIPSIGTDFNPEIHEAIDTIEVEPEKEGKVTLEYQTGYKIGEKLLRPAKVQVGKAK